MNSNISECGAGKSEFPTELENHGNFADAGPLTELVSVKGALANTQVVL